MPQDLIARSPASAGLLSRLARDRRGLAMVEFAYTVPLLLMAGMMGLEATNLVLAHMRVSRMASMVADNASRVRDSVDEADIIEVMLGAQQTSGGLDIRANGRVILSAVQQNTTATGQWIRWQRCYGLKVANSSYGPQDKGRTDDTLPGVGSQGVTAMTGSTVMFAEIVYEYQPLIAGEWGGAATTIRYASAYNVRKRPNMDPTNASGLTPERTARCARPSFDSTPS